jgi:hypothetical protein
MLSAQRKEFDEKKKDESPYPRDFARWYALDYFRRPRRLKSLRYYVTLATTVAVALFCLATMVPALHKTHQAAPLSTAHALFNQNCAACHDEMFQPPLRLVSSAPRVSTSDKSCLQCHDGATHHAKQATETSCATCHREHQGHGALAAHVADRRCVDCHGELTAHLKLRETTTYNPAITDFNRDHPDFQPSLKGKKDPSKIKFNHKAHLELALDDLRRADGRPEIAADLKGLGAKLTCVDCHQMDEARRYLLPIRYDNHCARCHQLNAGLVGDFSGDLKKAAMEFAKTPLPHKEPAVIRAVLRDRLVQFAQQNGVGVGQTASVPRPLPWRSAQPVTEGQWAWATKQADKVEVLVFMNKQWSKQEPLTMCSHCHIETAAGRARPNGLPSYEATQIPSRWYTHSLFNHGSHRLMSCVACHDRNAGNIAVAQSTTAADILLPTLNTCQECHRPSGGARNTCIECHRYHDRALERSPDGAFKLTEVLEKGR